MAAHIKGMTYILYTHHLPGETVKDLSAAERDFHLDYRSALEATPKGMDVAKVLLDIPAGYSFTVRAASYREGDPVHQLSSFAKARSVSIGSGAKGGRIRAIEPGTEQGGEVLIHPAAFISSFESMAA